MEKLTGFPINKTMKMDYVSSHLVMKAVDKNLINLYTEFHVMQMVNFIYDALYIIDVLNINRSSSSIKRNKCVQYVQRT